RFLDCNPVVGDADASDPHGRPLDFRSIFLYKWHADSQAPGVFRPPSRPGSPETILMSKEPEPRAPRRAPRRVIDWPRAARLFDQGLTVAEVAERIGCSRSALTRRRRTDPRFQNRTEPPVEVAPEEDAADLR